MRKAILIASAMLMSAPALASEIEPPTIVRADPDGNYAVTLHVTTPMDAAKQHETLEEQAKKVAPFTSVTTSVAPRKDGGFDVTYTFIGETH